MRKIIPSLLASVAFMGSIEDASAEVDCKTYNGWFCVELWDTAPEIYYVGGGCAENNSTGSNTWGCPVVRDIVASSMDISDWDVVVYRHANSTAAWNITLWSTDICGWNGYGDTITVPSGEGYHTVDGGRIDSAHINGQLFVESTVPRQARICSYMVCEEE